MAAPQQLKRWDVARAVVVAAALVVIVAGMRAAAELLVPLLVSGFLALICGPALVWLRRKGVPSGLAVALIVLGLVGIGTGVGLLVGSSINDFYQALPEYQERIQEQSRSLMVWFENLGLAVPDTLLSDVIQPGAVMQLAAGLLSGVGGLVTDTLIIVLMVVFLLLEASSFSAKIRAAVGDPSARYPQFDTITQNVNRYLAIKTWVSLATGLIAGVWVAVLGVDFAVLWGLLAFLLNYIPNIGSVIAGIPPVLLALVQFGAGKALLVLAGYVVINNVLGNVVEPRFLGRSLGLSTLVVFVSLVFWQWVLGPVGMLLSVPLTMTLKIALESHEDTHWLAILLGSSEAAEEELRAEGAATELSQRDPGRDPEIES
jgi:predicted PurR-regulated permease PerM